MPDSVLGKRIRLGDGGFWEFSLEFYRRPNVAQACLTLQDEAGVDVNVLLFALWQAARQTPLAPQDLADVDGCIAEWRETVVAPLRAIRRDMKSLQSGIDGPATALREQIKALELESERIQQQRMASVADRFASRDVSPLQAARANIQSCQAHYSAKFPGVAVDTLLDAFCATAGGGR